MNTLKDRRGFLKLAAGALVVACVPVAASAAKSNLNTSVGTAAKRAGVPADCIKKMTTNDAARIKSMANRPRDSHARRQRKIREYVKKICRTR